jgi:flagella basal body P-ring formation protein FlgA
MTMTIRIPLLTFVTLLRLGAAAAAAEVDTLDPQRPVLKSEATVTGDLVRVGDLVEHAGIIAKVPIFRAPDLGSTGTVSADDVVEAVRAHALIGLDTGGLSEVKVTRAARTIPAADIEAAVAHALATQYSLGAIKDITVTFEREVRAMYVDPSARGEPRVAHINYEPRSGRFDATLDIPTGAATRGTLRLSGRAQATVEVVTVARLIERGGVLKDADISIEKRPRAEMTRDVITDRDQAVGLAARAALQPGRPLRTSELMRPEVIQRNDAVTLIFEVPGIRLTVRGKASEAGAEGDTISVLNEQTKRIVQGVVVGPGRVVISSSTPRLAANIPPTRPAGNNRP